MFVEFDKVFKKKTQKELSIPDSLLAHMNKSLPEGLSYRILEDGNCHVTGNSGEFKISGLVFKPTAEQQAVLGENFTHEDLVAYMYNSQQEMRLELETPGKLVVNGKEISVSQFVQNPYNQIEIVDGSFWTAPKPFPSPFNLEIGSEKYQRKLTVHRIPNQSVYTAKFQSDTSEPFILQYFANEKAQTLQFSVSLNLKAAHTIRDFVESVSIFNAFMDGTATLEGQPIPTKVDGDAEKRFDEKSIVFWEKVLSIEEYLNVSFVPPQEDVDYETMCIVEQLYQSFIFGKPTRDLQRVNSISGTWVPEGAINPEDCIGKHIFSSFDGSSTIELFGVKLDLYCIVGQCNAIVSDLVVDDGKYTMTFSDVSKDKPFFTSVIYFKDEDTMKKSRDNFASIAEEMHNALKPSSYF